MALRLRAVALALTVAALLQPACRSVRSARSVEFDLTYDPALWNR